jgi:hypothetical protein
VRVVGKLAARRVVIPSELGEWFGQPHDPVAINQLREEPEHDRPATDDLIEPPRPIEEVQHIQKLSRGLPENALSLGVSQQ